MWSVGRAPGKGPAQLPEAVCSFGSILTGSRAAPASPSASPSPTVALPVWILQQEFLS